MGKYRWWNAEEIEARGGIWREKQERIVDNGNEIKTEKKTEE